ncbi:exonuclease domain-containing protein [Pseudoalteromonas sp. SSM20]|uniref:exonuclease domain-containing protein n=1 Tax=Pseudoalteromonas sp. SSM20 TaxID=3139394 RepID=UPI003BAAC774
MVDGVGYLIIDTTELRTLMEPEYNSGNLNSLINDYRHIVVVDIEHTCAMDGSIPPEERETIEIGAVLLDTCSLQIIDEFSCLIRPVIHPKLSKFCTELTGITQSELDVAEPFPKLFANFIDWLPSDAEYIFATWGAYDLVQLNIDCASHGMPEFSPSTTLNLKIAFKEARNLKKKVGLKRALEIANLSYEGNHHRALDDAKNTAKLLPLIFNDKERPGIYEATIKFEINEDSLTMDEIDDSLFDVGFDDAIVSHSGDGKVAIELSRAATSYADLVESVMAKVKNAIPSAKVIRASRDSWQTSQKQHTNPFKNNGLANSGVDVTTSRIRSRKKLESIAEIDDGYIVDIPDDKEMLHPARYFEALYLQKLRAQGLSNNDLSKMLGLSVEQFDDFLIEKISVTLTLAKRLEAVTGMPSEFWLRTQTKFDKSRK